MKDTNKEKQSQPKVSERNQILSRRVYIRMWQPIAGHSVIALIGLFFGILFTFGIKNAQDIISLILTITVASLGYGLVAYLIVSLILDIIKISKYNALGDVYIEFKANEFTLHMADGQSVKVAKDDIDTVTAKVKKQVIFSPHYVFMQTYKLGSLTFNLKDENHTSYTLNFVPDAQKVYEKINKLLGIKVEKQK
jgi:hypothetical protein